MSSKQRTSTRNVKISKAFRVVDEDTRRAVQEQRLQQLETDNYVEVESMGRDDEDFEDEVSMNERIWTFLSFIFMI